jgi:tRNA A-37 threonylcarbamoyl transferase component Bud32
VHGIIFFYIQKFADVATAGKTTWLKLRETVATSASRYLPNGTYPDGEAVGLLQSLAERAGEPLPALVERFGEFVAPHLVKVAGRHIDPSWRTLDLIENTESIIHTMIRATNPGAEPPVLEAVRHSPNELHLVYGSSRQLCVLARGIMKGVAKHYGESITIDETSCMLHGGPFCSFVVQDDSHETHSARSPLSETIIFDPDSGEQRPVEGGGWQPAHPFVDRPAGELPEAIGGFAIKSLIGHGGMGRVYLGHDDQLGRRVAIKLMHPSRAEDAVSRQRFLRESKATAAINHPHVVTIYQVGEHAGLPYIVMQHVDGPNLADYRTAGGGTVATAEAVRIGRELAEGLAAAHDHGLVHRDIKPDNILLEGSARRVRIIDFGLARELAAADTRLTVDGAVVGTPAYMSPERIGVEEVDAKSDLFGLGVILYELLAGRLPFEGKSMVSILAAIARGTPPALAELVPTAPQALTDLVMQLLAHDKADRPATAAEVARQLATIEKALG